MLPLSYYWYWDEEKETVMTHSKPLLIGDEEYETDIKDERVERVFDDMLREDWMIANEENCPILCDKAVFSFGDAITYLKKGVKWHVKVGMVRGCSCLSQMKSISLRKQN